LSTQFHGNNAEPICFQGEVIGGATIRFGGSQYQLRAAAKITCGFIGAMASCNESTRTSAIIFAIFGSLGVGIAEVIAIITVPFTVSPDDLGLASGVLGSCRSNLGSVEFAIFSSVLRTRKDEEILRRLIGLAEQHHLSNSSVAIL
jgi:hypothetical protein